MKRLQRVIIALVCIVCLAFGMTACGNDTTDADGKTTYTVTVKGSDYATLCTVKVKLVDYDTDEEAAAEKPLVLADTQATSGKVTFKVKAGKYKVVLSSPALTSYNVPEKTVTASVHSVTVELTKKGEEGEDPSQKVEYKVRFLLPDNTPAANLGVQICKVGSGGQCVAATTDADGYASFKNMDVATYEVHVPEDNWPKDCFFDDTKYKVTPAEKEITVKFSAFATYTVHVYKAKQYADPISGNTILVKDESAPVSNVAVSLSVYDEYTGKVTIENIGSGTTNAEGVAEIKAPEGSVLSISVTPPNGYSVHHSGQTMITSDETTADVVIAEDGIDKTARIAIEEGTQTLTVSADKSGAWYEFMPNGKSGIYTVTAESSLDTYCEYYTGSANSITSANLAVADSEAEYISYKDDASESDKNFQFEFGIKPAEVAEDALNNFVIYVGVKDDVAAPADVTFTITWKEKIVITEIVVSSPKAEELIAVADQPAIPEERKFEFLEFNSDTVVKNEEDGLYHRNDKNGPVIYALINSDQYLPRTFDSSLYKSSLGEGARSFILSDGKTYRHNYLSFIAEYKNSSNADGMHPLTEELMTFLNSFAYNQGVHLTAGWTVDETNRDRIYYFDCGYYVDKYNTPVGEGTEASRYVVTTGEYKMSIAAGTSFFQATFKGLGSDDYAVTVKSGSVKLLDSTGAEVTQAVVNGSQPLFSMRNEGTAAVTVIFEIAVKTADREITALGEYLVLGTYDETGSPYEFVAPEKGTYKITADSDNAVLLIDNPNPEDKDLFPTSYMPDSFALEKGETFKFYCAIMNGTEETYHIVIDEAPAELAIGDNSVKATTPDGKSGEFMADAAGSYKIVYDDTTVAVQIVDSEGIEEFVASGSIIAIKQYQKVTFKFYSNDFTSTIPIPFTLNITSTNKLAIGENNVASSYDGVEYTFTATEDGTYAISCEDDNCMIYADTTEYNPFTSPVTLTAGQSVTVYISYNTGMDPTFVLKVEKQEAAA